jgi:hypothetical protein
VLPSPPDDGERDSMLRILVPATILLTGADHWTTYLCLRAPIEGWTVSEANPFADWLFEHAGLVGGLAIDSAITLGAIAFVAMTEPLARWLKATLLALSTGFAVVSNLDAITRMGLAPWSGTS